MSKSTILAAVEDGRIVGMKDLQDVWYVERTQLYHVFPPEPPAPPKSAADNLDAAALVLEVGISALVRTAGDTLRGRRTGWHLLRSRPDKPTTQETG